jgi:hypothetical protein
MDANQLNHMLRFVGGRPMLILRDHAKGRIKVYLKGEWAFTVIPGELLCYECDAVLLGCEDAGQYAEERTTWGGVAHALSMFQQTGEVPCMDSEGFEHSFD